MDVCPCVYAVCACTHVVNVCASICATVHIHEGTALMSLNRAKQPYMQTECSQFQLLAMLWDLVLHVICNYTVILVNGHTVHVKKCQHLAT